MVKFLNFESKWKFEVVSCLVLEKQNSEIRSVDITITVQRKYGYRLDLNFLTLKKRRKKIKRGTGQNSINWGAELLCCPPQKRKINYRGTDFEPDPASPNWTTSRSSSFWAVLSEIPGTRGCRAAQASLPTETAAVTKRPTAAMTGRETMTLKTMRKRKVRIGRGVRGSRGASASDYWSRRTPPARPSSCSPSAA